LFKHRAAVFGLTFACYACYHMSRKPYSITKSALAPVRE
jgi:hypothetical protein